MKHTLHTTEYYSAKSKQHAATLMKLKIIVLSESKQAKEHIQLISIKFYKMQSDLSWKETNGKKAVVSWGQAGRTPSWGQEIPERGRHTSSVGQTAPDTAVPVLCLNKAYSEKLQAVHKETSANHDSDTELNIRNI